MSSFGYSKNAPTNINKFIKHQCVPCQLCKYVPGCLVTHSMSVYPWMSGDTFSVILCLDVWWHIRSICPLTSSDTFNVLDVWLHIQCEQPLSFLPLLHAWHLTPSHWWSFMTYWTSYRYKMSQYLRELSSMQATEQDSSDNRLTNKQLKYFAVIHLWSESFYEVIFMYSSHVQLECLWFVGYSRSAFRNC